MITLAPSTTTPNTYSLNWSNQQSHIFSGLQQLGDPGDSWLTDVTLACDGEYIQAHKLVLSLCSAFFKDLFLKNQADKSNTIIILGNVSAQNLRNLIRFIYQGKVDIPSKDVDSFLQAGNMLKVEGLIGNVGNSGAPVNTQTSLNGPHTSQISQAASERGAVPYIPGPASKKHASSNVSLHRSDTAATPMKKPRLSETGASSFPCPSSVDSTPVIVGEPVSIKSTQEQTTSSTVTRDPLDDMTQYSEDLEGEDEVEEDIEFHRFKTEPIQVYSSGYPEGDQAALLHGDDEDAYGDTGEANFGLSPSSASAPVPVHAAVPGSSSSTHASISRPKGSLPEIPSGSAYFTNCVPQRVAHSNSFEHALLISGPEGDVANPPGIWRRRRKDCIESRPVPAKTRSKVYNFFLWDENIRQWRCKLCQRHYTHNRRGGSASLLNHLHRSHQDVAKMNFGEREHRDLGAPIAP